MLKFISLEEGMLVVEEAIVKAKKKMEGYEMKFTGEEYQRFYEYPLWFCRNGFVLHLDLENFCVFE